MPSSEERFASSEDKIFQHIYRDRLRDLELSRSENQAELNSKEQTQESHRILFEQYDRLMDRVIRFLKFPWLDDASATVEGVREELWKDPESVLRAALRALDHVEHYRFILDNLREVVKRDESLQDSIQRYGDLGWLYEPHPNLPPDKRHSPWGSFSGSGRVLRKLWGRLRKVALALMQIIINALKVIPRLVALKAKPSIGMAGLFPTFSLEFELEAEGITLDELFRMLTESVVE
jgi:hypothetical protein